MTFQTVFVRFAGFVLSILLFSCQQMAVQGQHQPATAKTVQTTHSELVPLSQGYAHNDYWHKRPLFDALDNGFTHIEVDIFKVGDEFVVAHLFPFFRQGKTLENIYLRPLYEHIIQHRGYVYRGYEKPITLMIDIKLGGENTYRSLKRLLKKYAPILTSYENGELVQRQVTVVLSGSKPFTGIQRENKRYAFIDEDLQKIPTSNFTTSTCPIASSNYRSLLSWNGEGEMPFEEKEKLIGYVSKAHEQGKKVRLWASPENENVWSALLQCGVDMINTDKLVSLKTFLLNKTKFNKMAVVSIDHTSPAILADRK